MTTENHAILSSRHKVAKGREDRAEGSGASERPQRRRVHPGATRRRRIQRQRLGIGERVRQRGMGRAREQSGVTQLSAIHRCHCLLGKTADGFRRPSRRLRQHCSEPIHFVRNCDVSLARIHETLACFKPVVCRVPNDPQARARYAKL